MIIYLNFDAIDGKQARRTGTSGPLGELFDHGKNRWKKLVNKGFVINLGCDAINLMVKMKLLLLLLCNEYVL